MEKVRSKGPVVVPREVGEVGVMARQEEELRCSACWW